MFQENECINILYLLAPTFLKDDYKDHLETYFNISTSEEFIEVVTEEFDRRISTGGFASTSSILKNFAINNMTTRMRSHVYFGNNTIAKPNLIKMKTSKKNIIDEEIEDILSEDDSENETKLSVTGCYDDQGNRKQSVRIQLS